MTKDQTAQKMNQSGSIETNSSGSPTRSLDPNVSQRQASEPNSSVWVGASAGTGKTKVLTDRVLRLLLPRSKEISGTPAHKILCLSFTKAAASEMALRINNTLADWAIMDEPKLIEKLENLLGRPPKDYEVKEARKLFAQVIDTAGGLKIMTLHSFCQSVLGRFPLEAGITPNFTVLDESDADTLMIQAQRFIYRKAQAERSSALAKALYNIASTISEDQFMMLLKDMAKERNEMRKTIGNWGIENFHSKLCQFLNIDPALNHHTLTSDFCDLDKAAEQNLRMAGALLFESDKKTDQARGETILNWINANHQTRISQLQSYFSAYLTQKQTIHLFI